MQICIDLCIVVSDIRTWQVVWYVVSGTTIFRCHQKFLYTFKIRVWKRISWFLAYAEVSDQYMPYVLYSNDMCQKRQMRSDSHLRRPVYDEMGETRTWKSKYSEKAYRRFMSGDLFSSVMNDCDRARPSSNGTTDVACRLMLVSQRRINVNHTWRAISHSRWTYNVAGARWTQTSRAALMVLWVEDSSEKVITI
jgi:hypothetical protein